MGAVNPACWLIRRRLGAYQDGELAGTARRRVEAHVGRCGACAGQLAELGRLHAALALDGPEPGQPVWDAFWPQVRARLASPAAVEAPAASWWRAWGGLIGRPRLAFGSAVAVAALGALAVLAPWQDAVQPPAAPPASVAAPGGATPGPAEAPALAQVLIQSAETDDPQSSVMVFDSPDSDVTVLWVFGLPRTDA